MSEELIEEPKGLMAELKQNKLLSISLIVILVGILGVAGYYFYDNYKKSKDAESNAGYYRELHLIGDTTANQEDQIANLEAYAEEFDGYKGGSIANYIVGTNLMKSKEWDLAIAALEKVELEDVNVGAIAKGCIGDCYMEMAVEQGSNDLYTQAYDAYMKAANHEPNQFTSPKYLMKAAIAAENLNNFESALENYKKIKEDYPLSNEGRSIDKYIARAENM